MQMPLDGHSHASHRGSFLQIWDSLIIHVCVCVCICEGKRLMLFTCLVHRLKGHFNPLYCDLYPLAPTPKSAKPFSTSYSLQRVDTGYLLFCAPERTLLISYASSLPQLSQPQGLDLLLYMELHKGAGA